MSNITNYLEHRLVEPPYYQRQYEHDLPELAPDWMETSKRTLLIALPFISLHKPFGFAISLVTGGMRSVSHLFDAGVSGFSGEVLVSLGHIGQLALSVATLASTLLNFQFGMLATTLFDALLNLIHAFEHLCAGEYSALFEQLLLLISSVLYISIMFTGSLEVVLVSLLVQGLISFYQAHGEWLQGRWPEFAAKLAMGIVRLNQAHRSAGEAA